MLLRVHPRTVYEACLALGAAQLAASLLFLLRRLLEGGPPEGAAPSAAVVVPCCGAGEGFEENVRAMLAQDYPGPLEFLFVTPSEDDPAHARLAPLMDGRCRLRASGLTPSRCSGKITDVLFALERARPQAEILAFADADLRVGPDWLRRLAAPLRDPSVGAATSFMSYRPKRGGLASCLRMAWMAAGTPFMELMGAATGQSLAMRRADFERLKVAELWSRSLFEDLALRPLLERAGLKTAFVGGAMPVSGEGTDLRSLLALSLKWVFAFRVYVPVVWALGLGMTLGKAYFLFYALRSPAWRAPILAALYAMDVLNLWLLSLAFRRNGGAALALWAPLMAPLVPVLYAYDFAVSAFMRGMRWGRWWYEVRGPQDVAAVGIGAGGAPGRWRLPRFPFERRVSIILMTMAAVSAGILLTARIQIVPTRTFEWSVLDRAIPLLGWAVPVYFSHFVLLLVAFLCLDEPDELDRTLWAMILSSVVGLGVFVLYPVVCPRPPLDGRAGLELILLRGLYGLDTPQVMVFPSFHVCFGLIAAASFRRKPGRFLPIAAWAALDIASTLLTKQHYLVDVAAGAALAAASLGFVGSRVGARAPGAAD